MKKAVIYARYRGFEEKAAQSIDDQIKKCTTYAEELGYSIVNTYIDITINGEPDTREERRRMMIERKAGEWDAIIVSNYDRLTRNKLELYDMQQDVKILCVELSEDQIGTSMLKGFQQYFKEYKKRGGKK